MRTCTNLDHIYPRTADGTPCLCGKRTWNQDALATLTKETTMTEEKKPIVKLVGRDGNAFAIIGACQQAARKAGWPKEKVDAMQSEMMSGDYNHLLATAMNYFEVR